MFAILGALFGAIIDVIIIIGILAGIICLPFILVGKIISWIGNRC
jgi:hypothetical protein